MDTKVKQLSRVCLAAVFLLTAGEMRAQHLPPPLRVYIPFDVAWTGMLETLEELKWPIQTDNRAQGQIRTDFKTYHSGTLTEQHLQKIGVKPKLGDGQWVRVDYQYEITIELVEAKETLVTVNTNIRALKRDFFGEENWVDIPSNGNQEAWLLTQFGKTLFGENFQLDEPKKGYWERAPEYVPEPMERIPRIPGPEKP